MEIEFYQEVISLFTNDTNYPIMHCEESEEPGPTPPGPTPPGPIPTKFVITLDGSTIADMGAVNVNKDTIGIDIDNIFNSLGSKFSLKVTYEQDSETKELLYSDNIVVQQYIKDSNDNVLLTSGIANTEFMNHIDAALVGVMFDMNTGATTFTPINNYKFENSEFVRDDSSALFSVPLTSDFQNVIQPATYEYELSEQQNYDMCLATSSALSYATDMSGGIFLFDKDSIDVEPGYYYDVTVTESQYNINEHLIAKCVRSANSNKSHDGTIIENLPDINTFAYYLGNGRYQGSLYANAGWDREHSIVTYDSSSTVLTYLGAMSTIYGPIEHTPQSHEVFSVTLTSDSRTYWGTDTALGLEENEWYSLTVKNNDTNEEEVYIGLCWYNSDYSNGENVVTNTYFDLDSFSVWSSKPFGLLDHVINDGGQTKYGNGFEFWAFDTWFNTHTASSYTFTLNAGTWS